MKRKRPNVRLKNLLPGQLFFQKAFFFCLPFQWGKFFWFPFSSVFGLRVDYLAGSVYLLDLLAAAWLATFLMTVHGRRRLRERLRRKEVWFGLAGLIVIGGAKALTGGEAGLFWLNWLQIVWLYLWYQGLAAQRIDWRAGLPFLNASLLVITGLALAQFVLGRSLQSVFWFLGERRFWLGQPEIANFSFGDKLWLRPYATFSHPNSLAGFLVLTAWWLVVRGGSLGKVTWLGLGLTVFLSLSRPAWVLLGLLAYFYRRRWRGWLGGLAFLLGITFSFRQTSFLRRSFLNLCAWDMVKQHPWLGVGLGEFLSSLAGCRFFERGDLFLQPVHNIFLLILAQSGVVGGFFFLGWLKNELVCWPKRARLVFWAMIFLGLWDHYLLTAVQLRYLVLVIFLSLGSRLRRGTIT